AVGIKVGDRETRDIVDIYAIPESEYVQLAYFNPDVGTHDYKTMPDAQVLAAARNREATARYSWSPYMHDPKLRRRLHRIRIPTLVLWGTSDRILSESYGRAYCAAISGARFELIGRAGDFPHLEQTEIFADRVFSFVDEPSHGGCTNSPSNHIPMPGKTTGAHCASIFPTANATPRSPPTCSIAITTSGCWPMNSASISCSMNTTKPRPACHRP